MTRDRHRQTIEALQIARESRDGADRQSAQELRTLVEQLADALGTPPDVREEALKAAALLDLGLLAVSQATIGAEHELSPPERSELQAAPLAAQTLVAGTPGYESAADAARHVRERWDGQGYPDGLKGEAIPLASRIVAVAGAFQAMSTPRPFRPAIPPRAILEELRVAAGSQFDPGVVQVFLRMISPLVGEERGVDG
ncbi:MAG: HD-GYP domain-containing protein [Solirubrobacterales bacterium]